MLIPYQDLNPDTLQALIEAFVLREGTDYGDSDLSLAEKVALVQTQLQRGTVVICYSEQEESVDLLNSQDYKRLLSQQQ
jgi:uncharacterized protein YheU (UPF0270 family)